MTALAVAIRPEFLDGWVGLRKLECSVPAGCSRMRAACQPSCLFGPLGRLHRRAGSQSQHVTRLGSDTWSRAVCSSKTLLCLRRQAIQIRLSAKTRAQSLLISVPTQPSNARFCLESRHVRPALGTGQLITMDGSSDEARRAGRKLGSGTPIDQGAKQAFPPCDCPWRSQLYPAIPPARPAEGRQRPGRKCRVRLAGRLVRSRYRRPTGPHLLPVANQCLRIPLDRGDAHDLTDTHS